MNIFELRTLVYEEIKKIGVGWMLGVFIRYYCFYFLQSKTILF